MEYYYTLIRQEDEPIKPQPGFFWLKQSIGQLYISIIGRWIPLVAGSATTDEDGVFWYSVTSQPDEPAPSTTKAGHIWIDTDTKQEFVYIGDWLPLLGG